MIFKNLEEALSVLKEKTGNAYTNTSRSEVICNCPWCEKFSQKNHGHLYISLEFPVFNCFKCQISGVLTKLFVYLKLDPTKYLSEDSYVKNWKSLNYIKNNNFSIIDYDVVDNKTSPWYDAKINYLKKRLGTDYDIESIPNLVFNIRDFLVSNNVNLPPHHLNSIELYDSNYIGFLSTRGYTLILRNIYESDVRYVKIKLTDEKIYFRDFYGIRTGNTNKINNTIVLCEGIFDLLNSVNNIEMVEIKRDSCYWAAIMGKSYKTAIKSVIDYCKLPMADVIILSDSDCVNSNLYNNLVNECPFIGHLKVIWNKIGRDFGDSQIDSVKVGKYPRPFDFKQYVNNRRYNR